MWILWFVITIYDGHLLHVPINTPFESQEACKKAIPEWEALIAEQFPDDPNLRVYCDEYHPAKGV